MKIFTTISYLTASRSWFRNVRYFDQSLSSVSQKVWSEKNCLWWTSTTPATLNDQNSSEGESIGVLPSYAFLLNKDKFEGNSVGAYISIRMKAVTDVGDDCEKTFTEWFMPFLAGVNAHAAEVARVVPPLADVFTDLKESEWGGELEAPCHRCNIQLMVFDGLWPHSYIVR